MLGIYKFIVGLRGEQKKLVDEAERLRDPFRVGDKIKVDIVEKLAYSEGPYRKLDMRQLRESEYRGFVDGPYIAAVQFFFRTWTGMMERSMGTRRAPGLS